MVESMDLLKQTSPTNWTYRTFIPDMSENAVNNTVKYHH
jgi:hypothetical protein